MTEPRPLGPRCSACDELIIRRPGESMAKWSRRATCGDPKCLKKIHQRWSKATFRKGKVHGKN